MGQGTTGFSVLPRFAATMHDLLYSGQKMCKGPVQGRNDLSKGRWELSASMCDLVAGVVLDQYKIHPMRTKTTEIKTG